MNPSIVIIAIALVVAGCASATTHDVASTNQGVESADLGIESAKEFNGLVETWNNAAPSNATLSVWVQRIRETDYVLFQVRANLDTYRFTLSHDQLVGVIDALDNYQMIVRQSSIDHAPAIGWLYRESVKMKRVGEDAKDDRVILNIERPQNSILVLSLTFDSWLLSFGGSSSPTERSYKAVVFTSQEASRLRTALSEFRSHL